MFVVIKPCAQICREPLCDYFLLFMYNVFNDAAIVRLIYYLYVKYKYRLMFKCFKYTLTNRVSFQVYTMIDRLRVWWKGLQFTGQSVT